MGFLKRLFGSKPDPMSIVDMDALVIEQLRKAGADLRMSRETIHYLYVPTRQDADRAAQELASDARTIDVKPGATGSNWLVLLTESIVVSPESIARLRTEFDAVCERFGGDYDGWEAAVTSDQA